MLDFNFTENCYGCGQCAYVCPKSAITMKPDEEGFLMPVIDDDKCIKCGLCVKKCIFLNPVPSERPIKEAVCKAAYRTDEAKRIKSASGGIAAVITERFVNDGKVVIGCAWTDELTVKHTSAKTLKEAAKFQSSKYVQSDMSDAYIDIKEALDAETDVLFIGTPCQTAAVRSRFGNHKNLYLIGLICGGVPSPKVWAAFKADMEKKYKSRMITADYRSKGRYGWNTPVALYRFENGRSSEKLSFQLDNYVLQYLYGVFKRNSCYQCQYKGDSINCDLVLGDYWGSPEFRDKSNNKGVSAILCLTEKGEYLSSLCGEECEIIGTDYEAILNKNQPLIHSVGRGGQRKEFFQSLDTEGYFTAAKKYGGKTNPIKYYGMWILDKTGLFELVKRKMKG